MLSSDFGIRFGLMETRISIISVSIINNSHIRQCCSMLAFKAPSTQAIVGSASVREMCKQGSVMHASHTGRSPHPIRFRLNNTTCSLLISRRTEETRSWGLKDTSMEG